MKKGLHRARGIVYFASPALRLFDGEIVNGQPPSYTFLLSAMPELTLEHSRTAISRVQDFIRGLLWKIGGRGCVKNDRNSGIFFLTQVTRDSVPKRDQNRVSRYDGNYN